MSLHTLRRAIAVALVLPILPVWSASAAEWDQEKVTELGAALASSLSALIADPGVSGTQSEALQDRKHQAALVDLRRMSEMADDLSRKLKAGQGREQTDAHFRQIRLMREGIREYARGSTITGTAPERIDEALDALAGLSAYYDAI